MGIRQSRVEWFASIFKPRPIKPRAKRTQTIRVAKKKWRYACPLAGASGVVLAFTRSQARSEIKKAHNIKGRVPLGSVITQVA